MIQKILVKPAFSLDDVLAICVLSKVYKTSFVHADAAGTVVTAGQAEILRQDAEENDLNDKQTIVLQADGETNVDQLNFAATDNSCAQTILEKYAEEHIAGGVQVLLNEIKAFNTGEKKLEEHPASLYAIVDRMNHEEYHEGLNKAVELLGDLFEASLECIPPQKQ